MTILDASSGRQTGTRESVGFLGYCAKLIEPGNELLRRREDAHIHRGGALKRVKISALLVGRPDRLLDCGGRPLGQLRLRHIAGWSGRAGSLRGPGRTLARSGKRIDLRLLLIA